MNLPKRRFILYVLLAILVVLAAFNIFGYYYLRSKNLKQLDISEPPGIKQNDYLVSSTDPKEEYKTTLYGKIVKIEGDIITLENENSVRVEIAEKARFYRVDPEKGLEQVSKEDFKLGENALAGNLSPSEVADYKAEIFSLTNLPTLLWREE